MAAVSNQIWYYIFGGLFLGFWLWFLFVPESHPEGFAFSPGAWFLWGLIGLAIAAGAFAGRSTSGPTQAVLWVVTGIAAAFVIASAAYEQSPHVFATALAGAGAFLIAGGIAAQYGPVPADRRLAGGSPPPASGPSREWRSAEPPAQVSQQQPGQQQSVTVVRDGQR